VIYIKITDFRFEGFKRLLIGIAIYFTSSFFVVEKLPFVLVISNFKI